MKKIIKTTKQFIGASMILPVGAKAVTALGGTGAGVAAVSGQMPMVGSLVGTHMTLGMMRKLHSMGKIYKPKKISIWR